MDADIKKEKHSTAIEGTSLPDPGVTCVNCKACCCRLEVRLLTDPGVPDKFIEIDTWGGMRMARMEDGWCSALTEPP
jgi:uncharacterized protein